MKKRDYINNLTSHVVFTLDTLFKDKASSPELLDYLYLITTGMIITYGEKYLEDIYNVISNVKYISTDSEKKDLLYYQNPTNHNLKKETIDFNNLATINYKYELNFQIIDSSPIKTLEYLTHELNANLFNKYKTISLKENLKVRFNYLTNNVIPLNLPKEHDNIINKIFNILETEEIIKEILLLKEENITNTKFKKALLLIKNSNPETYKTEGFDILANLLRPLYEQNNFKNIINSPKERKLIEKEIDNVLGKNSYKEICQKIESLQLHLSNSNNNTNYYYLSLEYVAIKNDYLNKLINIKYA